MAQLIKKIRISKGISQNKMAKDLHISQGYLSSVESGQKSPTLRNLRKFAQYLEVCPAQLIMNEDICSKCANKNCSIKINRDKE